MPSETQHYTPTPERATATVKIALQGLLVGDRGVRTFTEEAPATATTPIFAVSQGLDKGPISPTRKGPSQLLAVERIEAATAAVVSAGINAAMDAPDPALVTYQTDQEYRAVHPDTVYPAAWHRAVIARIAQEVPAVEIIYPPSEKTDRELILGNTDPHSIQSLQGRPDLH